MVCDAKGQPLRFALTRGDQDSPPKIVGMAFVGLQQVWVSTGVLIGLCAASLRGLATVSRQLWSLSG